MTCLIPPPAFAAAGQPDDSAEGRRARGLSLVGAAFQRLLDQWRGLGLELDVFLPTLEALPRLSAWSNLQLGQLQQTLTALADDPQACRELASGLQSLATGTDAVDCRTDSESWTRSLLWLRPLLSLKGLTRRSMVPTLPWPQLPCDPLQMPVEELGLSIRVLNLVRRNRLRRLVDLVGLGPQQLFAMHGMGETSVNQIAAVLEQHGLPLPFGLEDGFALPPLPRPQVHLSLVHSVQAVQAAPQQSFSPVPRTADPAEEGRWVARAAALLGCSDPLVTPQRLLQDLKALTVERFPSLRHRFEDIHQLQELLRSVATAARLAAMETRQSSLWQEAVQQRLLRRYSDLIAAGESTTDWFLRLGRHLHRYPQSLQLLMLHLPGRSLTAIGQANRRPLSRDRVRHQIQALEQLLGLRVEALRHSVQERIARQDSDRKATVLRDWIAAHGRLLFHTDEEAPAASPDQEVMDLFRHVRNLSLSRRLALYAELGLPVPEAEWDLHFRVLVNNQERPGTGYWETLEPLRQLLPRFAALLGAPGLMPKQTQLPPAVHSAVQRHGGQSRVAEAIGLAYQGQLVGEHGRAYWTELRLEQLLAQTVSSCRLPLRTMPSRLQIRTFMQSGLVAEYADKRFETVYAALTRQCTLSWPQVAQRFGRA